MSIAWLLLLLVPIITARRSLYPPRRGGVQIGAGGGGEAQAHTGMDPLLVYSPAAAAAAAAIAVRAPSDAPCATTAAVADPLPTPPA